MMKRIYLFVVFAGLLLSGSLRSVDTISRKRLMYMMVGSACVLLTGKRSVSEGDESCTNKLVKREKQLKGAMMFRLLSEGIWKKEKKYSVGFYPSEYDKGMENWISYVRLRGFFNNELRDFSQKMDDDSKRKDKMNCQINDCISKNEKIRGQIMILEQKGGRLTGPNRLYFNKKTIGIIKRKQALWNKEMSIRHSNRELLRRVKKANGDLVNVLKELKNSRGINEDLLKKSIKVIRGYTEAIRLQYNSREFIFPVMEGWVSWWKDFIDLRNEKKDALSLYVKGLDMVKR